MKKLIFVLIIMILGISAAYSYSGLIIDATSSIAPRDVRIECSGSEKLCVGNKVLSGDVNSVLDKGLICYTPSIDIAKDSGFVGDNPLIVRILNRFDDIQATNIIIPATEAEEIIQVSRDQEFLGNLKIAIVM